MNPFSILDFGFSIARSQGSKALCLALCAMLFGLCLSVQAQQPGRIPRIGFLPLSGDANNPGIEVRAFQQRLRDLGYIEGKIF
jgi:hypothetical protein